MCAKYVSKCNHDSRRDTEKRWSTSFVKDMSHVCIRYVARMKEAMCRMRVTSRHGSCRTCEWAMSPWGMSHGWRVVNGARCTYMQESFHVWPWRVTCHRDMSCKRRRRVSHRDVACCTQRSMLHAMRYVANKCHVAYTKECAIDRPMALALSHSVHTYIQTNIYAYTHNRNMHTHTLTHAHTHRHTHTHTHSLTYTRTQTHTLAHSRRQLTSSLIPILFTSSSDQSLILWSNLYTNKSPFSSILARAPHVLMLTSWGKTVALQCVAVRYRDVRMLTSCWPSWCVALCWSAFQSRMCVVNSALAKLLCCSVLQRVAQSCIVLHCIAVCCSELQCVARLRSRE